MIQGDRIVAGMLAMSMNVAVAAAPEGSPEGVGQQVTMGLMFYQGCVASYPELSTRYAKGYRAWRQRNSTMIAVLENEPGVKSAINEMIRQRRENAAREGADSARAQCEKFFSDTFAENATAPTPAPARSPEDTWKRLLEALRAGDVERAVECYAPASRARYRDTLKALAPAELKAYGSSLTRFRLLALRSDAQAASGTVTLDDGREVPVSFVRDPAQGAWFIQSM